MQRSPSTRSPCPCRDQTLAFSQRVRQARSAAHAPSELPQQPTIYTLYARNPRQAALLAKRSRADSHWITEARRVRESIVALIELLTAVRRPYLAPPSARRAGRSGSSARPSSPPAAQDGLADARARWGVADSLSEAERDQVDTHVRLTIQKTMSRIQELETAERVRQRSWVPAEDQGLFSFLTSKSSSGSATTSHDSDPFSDAYSHQLAEVRFAICACLSEALAGAGNRQRNLQEQRLIAQQKRLALSDMASSSRTAAGASSSGPTPNSAAIRGATRTLTTGLGSSAAKARDRSRAAEEGTGDDAGPTALADTVSSEQALMFDSENAALLTSLQSDLAAVEAAEQKLRDISELQTQLIQHLGQQNEMTTMLLDDSQAHTLEVQRGNTQLSQAHRSNRQATKLLCGFLIGSGVSLLFLHCTSPSSSLSPFVFVGQQYTSPSSTNFDLPRQGWANVMRFKRRV